MYTEKIREIKEAEETYNNLSLNSTEETVCSPEFPDGCMDVEQ